MSIDKPVAKFTAATAILGTLAASFVMFYQGIPIPEAGYALIGGIISGAGVYLFKKDSE